MRPLDDRMVSASPIGGLAWILAGLIVVTVGTPVWGAEGGEGPINSGDTAWVLTA